MKNKYIVGIDEVGRGPLAGPVAIGVVVYDSKNEKEIRKVLREVRDSKKLSKIKREEISNKVKIFSKSHILRYIIGYENNKVIDKKGISYAINSCLEKSFKKLKKELSLNNRNTKIFLDGGLKAPSEFENQKTIIKGDDKEFSISLASIVAKVSRDNLMTKLSKKYPKYGFEVHKGYGTLKHRNIIHRFGLTSIHRVTFCKNIDF